MLSADPATVVLHVSDMHVESEEKFGANYESLESYRQAAYLLLMNPDRSVKWVDTTYDVLHSRVPQHVGVREGSSDERDR
jgi:hypothetical protein